VGDAAPVDLARAMNATWARFARSGSPEGPLSPWPAYEPGPRTTMVLGDQVRVEEDPMGEERALWEGVR